MRPFLTLACLATALALSCRGQAREPAPTAAPQPSRPDDTVAAPVVVEVQTASGNRLRVTAELARTDAERARGLMFRSRLAADAGMLFLMPRDDDWAFWMRNTLIPLDILFADADGRVVGVIEDARPLDETSRKVGAPSRYVLEVNGGWCRAHGVGVGATLVVVP